MLVVHNNEAPDEAAGVAFLRSLYGEDTRWVQCSYNASMRKAYPGPGWTFNAAADVFIEPQPYPSWTLDANYDWQAPTLRPSSEHVWSEEHQQWIPA